MEGLIKTVSYTNEGYKLNLKLYAKAVMLIMAKFKELYEWAAMTYSLEINNCTNSSHHLRGMRSSCPEEYPVSPSLSFMTGVLEVNYVR